MRRGWPLLHFGPDRVQFESRRADGQSIVGSFGGVNQFLCVGHSGLGCIQRWPSCAFVILQAIQPGLRLRKIGLDYFPTQACLFDLEIVRL